MMDKDYFRAANLLIKQHGKDAESVALAKMRTFMDAEDVAAASAWLMISQAIRQLTEQNPNVTVH